MIDVLFSFIHNKLLLYNIAFQVWSDLLRIILFFFTIIFRYSIHSGDSTRTDDLRYDEMEEDDYYRRGGGSGSSGSSSDGSYGYHSDQSGGERILM